MKSSRNLIKASDNSPVQHGWMVNDLSTQGNNIPTQLQMNDSPILLRATLFEKFITDSSMITQSHNEQDLSYSSFADLTIGTHNGKSWSQISLDSW
jgi:hypothetical protein